MKIKRKIPILLYTRIIATYNKSKWLFYLALGGLDMKTKKQKQVVAIQTQTAEQFNHDINAVLTAHDNTNITFVTSIPFTAYVEYEELVEIPETLAEKYELNNDERYCHECPYFIRTKDKRYKWHYCAQKQRKVTECQGACETYYQLLEEMIKEALEVA